MSARQAGPYTVDDRSFTDPGPALSYAITIAEREHRTTYVRQDGRTAALYRVEAEVGLARTTRIVEVAS